MIPGCERKSEQRAHRRGGEPRSGQTPGSGDREKGQGPRRWKGRTESNQVPRGQLAQGSAKPRRAQGGAKLRPARGRAALRLATPPQRRLGDNRRPTYARAAANLGVPLPQQVRCRGAHRAKKTRGRLRGRKPNPLNLSVSAGVGSISGSIWGARLCWRPIFMPRSADGAGP